MDLLTLSLTQLPWPADWERIYQRSAPILVEIGFGNGQHLVTEALSRPDANVLGLEIAAPSMRKAEARVNSAGLTNVRLIRASAQSVLRTLFTPASICGVTINFPDPWPKAAHAHRRLITGPFLELLASRLILGASLDIATDHTEYGQDIAALLQASPHFHSRLDTTYILEDRNRQRTKYERKGMAAGRRCHYFKWQRNRRSGPGGFPVLQELPMPHAIVSSPLELEEIAQGFETQNYTAADGSIRLIELYRSQNRPALLVDTYIAAQPIEQRLMLEIYRRPDETYVLRVFETGFPRSTAAVHAALDCLAQWLSRLHPDSGIVRHNLRL